MLAALTAAESPEDVEVAQELLQKGNMDAHASQVQPCPLDDVVHKADAFWGVTQFSSKNDRNVLECVQINT